MNGEYAFLSANSDFLIAEISNNSTRLIVKTNSIEGTKRFDKIREEIKRAGKRCNKLLGIIDKRLSNRVVIKNNHPNT